MGIGGMQYLGGLQKVVPPIRSDLKSDVRSNLNNPSGGLGGGEGGGGGGMVAAAEATSCASRARRAKRGRLSAPALVPSKPPTAFPSLPTTATDDHKSDRPVVHSNPFAPLIPHTLNMVSWLSCRRPALAFYDLRP